MFESVLRVQLKYKEFKNMKKVKFNIIRNLMITEYKAMLKEAVKIDRINSKKKPKVFN
jgi:hypothetical protein